MGVPLHLFLPLPLNGLETLLPIGSIKMLISHILGELIPMDVYMLK